MLFQIQNFFMSRSRHDHFPRLSKSETETKHWHSETETLKNVSRDVSRDRDTSQDNQLCWYTLAKQKTNKNSCYAPEGLNIFRYINLESRLTHFLRSINLKNEYTINLSIKSFPAGRSALTGQCGSQVSKFTCCAVAEDT